jgi:hypothetical protein
MPAAIAAQNRCRSSRPATGGRPGDDNGARPHRRERRFRMLIATSFVKVLRRPLESALNAVIGMVDQAWTGPLRREGRPCCQRQVGPQMILRRPAHDYAAVEIHDTGQIDTPSTVPGTFVCYFSESWFGVRPLRQTGWYSARSSFAAPLAVRREACCRRRDCFAKIRICQPQRAVIWHKFFWFKPSPGIADRRSAPSC